MVWQITSATVCLNVVRYAKFIIAGRWEIIPDINSNYNHKMFLFFVFLWGRHLFITAKGTVLF